MTFPGEYFEDEVRCGFLVPSFMKRWWAEELRLLSEIDKVCRKHGIRWFAYAGTLLGAVREGGFIPWDDDIDICMLRADYERFKGLFRSEFPKEYKLRNYETDMMEYHICLTNGHLIHEGDELSKHDNYPFVTGVDIFPIDFLPDDADERKKLRDDILLIDKAVFYIDDLNKGKKTSINKEEFKNALEKISEISHKKLDPEKPSLKELYRIADRRMAAFSSGREVTNIRDWVGKDRFRFSKEYFDVSLSLPFERADINVPLGYGAVLTAHFGSGFMERRKEKAAHDYPAFEQGMKAWKEVMGSPFFRYVFTGEALPEEERQLNATPMQRYRMLLTLLPIYHKEIESAVDDDRAEDVMSLLADCQDAATAIGEDIETCGEIYLSAVSLLEEYCKRLYMVYEPVSTGDMEEAKKNIEGLHIIYEEIIKNFKEEIKAYYRIVFLVRRSSEWESIRKILEESKSRKDCIVYVIPVPYSHISTKGEVTDDKWELKDFPPEVETLDYRVVDIEAIHPDIIFTQLPYDGYSYSYATSNGYYSDKLYYMCQKLVYVPPFITEDYSDNDERAKKMMEYITTLSVMEKADRIIVQSDKIKSIYLEEILKFDRSCDNSFFWDEKIISIYSGIMEEFTPI